MQEVQNSQKKRGTMHTDSKFVWKQGLGEDDKK